MNYKVLSHYYTNAGGGCMVSTFQVWLEDENKTVFLHVNEEGCTVATCDYINYQIEFVEDMTLENFHVDSIGDDNKYFELFRYCMVEYVKRDCKRYGYRANFTYELLPAELQQELTPEYLDWHYENVGDSFETDGYIVFLSEEYTVGDPEILKAKEMIQYMRDELQKSSDDDDYTQKFYDLTVAITFGDKTITIPNCAATYNSLELCLKNFLDEY